jgi:hypothetical protein
MATALVLPAGAALFMQDADGVFHSLTEHNRSPIIVETQRFEKTSRMANGSLRKLFIADKKTVSTSWSMVPSYTSMTVDGYWGAEDIKNFYLSAHGQGTFNVKIAYNSTRTETFLASFTSCSSTMVRRNVKEKAADTAQVFWDLSIALEEV